MYSGGGSSRCHRCRSPPHDFRRYGSFFSRDLLFRHVQELCGPGESISPTGPGVCQMKMIKRPVQRMPRKKLRAAAARKSARYDEEEYFVEEPNVKLSRAFMVVLLLHVVAVGAIFAFSTLKDRQSSSNPAKNQTENASPSSTPGTNIAANRNHTPNQTMLYQVKEGDKLAGITAQYGL